MNSNIKQISFKNSMHRIELTPNIDTDTKELAKNISLVHNSSPTSTSINPIASPRKTKPNLQPTAAGPIISLSKLRDYMPKNTGSSDIVHSTSLDDDTNDDYESTSRKAAAVATASAYASGLFTLGNSADSSSTCGGGSCSSLCQTDLRSSTRAGIRSLARANPKQARSLNPSSSTLPSLTKFTGYSRSEPTSVATAATVTACSLQRAIAQTDPRFTLNKTSQLHKQLGTASPSKSAQEIGKTSREAEPSDRLEIRLSLPGATGAATTAAAIVATNTIVVSTAGSSVSPRANNDTDGDSDQRRQQQRRRDRPSLASLVAEAKWSAIKNPCSAICQSKPSLTRALDRVSQLEQQEHRRVDTSCLKGKHNMTPSSLLVLHNHNFIGHQKQQLTQRQSDQEQFYQDDTTADTQLEQSKAKALDRQTSNKRLQSEGEQDQRQQQQSFPAHSLDGAVSPACLMLADVSSEFKPHADTKTICNQSSANNFTGRSNYGSTNHSNLRLAKPSDSPNSASLSACQIGSKSSIERTQSSHLLDVTSVEQAYTFGQQQQQKSQQLRPAYSRDDYSNSANFSPYALRTPVNLRPRYSLHQSVQASQVSTGGNSLSQQPNFTNSMLEHQIKLDSDMLSGNASRVYNHNYHPLFNDPNSYTDVNNQMVETDAIVNNSRQTDSPKKPVQLQQHHHQQQQQHQHLQAKNQINQYYNGHYSMIQTQNGASKSSSPETTTTTHSNQSTPSPRTKAMLTNINQQHVAIAASSSTQFGVASNNFSPTCNSLANNMHLDHLSGHYIGNHATNGMNQMQQQTVHQQQSQEQHQQHFQQHYAYNQSSLSGQAHPNFSTDNQEQAYEAPSSQIPQHHHLQQQDHLHHHHQQQQQNHQMQQHNQYQQQQQLQVQTQQQQNNHQTQHQTQHQTVQNHQTIYQQLSNNTSTGASVNHLYGHPAGSVSNYQNHLQAVVASGHHQTGLVSGHPNQGGSTFNSATAAAACAAAAVVSQTLKTVTSQQNQQYHHYGGSVSGYSQNTSGIMNMTPQHQHQQQQQQQQQQLHSFHHPSNQLVSHQGPNLIAQQRQQSSIQVQHATGIAVRKYQCKMCPQVFMSKAEMKYHNQNHMREAKPYKCLQCPKAFANSSYLSQHMRIHQGVKPYGCDICARKFTQLSHLQQHKRTHTGDKPYKCTYMNCTKQFSQLSNLQSHSRCHQLDKPYKCNSCYKCFHDESSLLEHIPRHLESKHLKKNLCIFCGSSYQQERGLVKHFQQYHTDKSPTLVAAAIAAGTTGNAQLIASLISSATSSKSYINPTNGTTSTLGSSNSSSCSTSSNLSTGSVIQTNYHPLGSTNNATRHAIVSAPIAAASGSIKFE